MSFKKIVLPNYKCDINIKTVLNAAISFVIQNVIS